MDNKIVRYDDTGAFGEEWLEVNAEFPDDNWKVSRADVRIGNLPVIVFDEPEFPIIINLTSEQTALLKDTDVVCMAVYDEDGLKRTCDGQVTVATLRRKV